MTSDFFESRAEECLAMAGNLENLAFVDLVLDLAKIFLLLSKVNESEKNSADFLQCVKKTENLFGFYKKLANL